MESKLDAILEKLALQEKTVAKLESLIVKVDDMRSSMGELREVQQNLETWRPKIDRQVAELTAVVGSLKDRLPIVNKPSPTALVGRGLVDFTRNSPPLLSGPGTPFSVTGGGHAGPSGHREDLENRGLALGNSGVSEQPPAKAEAAPRYPDTNT